MGGGASGGAFMGQSFKLLAAGMREALGVFKQIASIHHGELKAGDVPLLIRALSIPNGGAYQEARKALTALAGQDLGPEPGPWLAWWQEHGPRILAGQAEHAAVRELFGRLREGVVTGRWSAVRGLLSERLRRSVSKAELVRIMSASAGALRRAYRDSRPAGIRLAGARGTLAVDWGEEGFEFAELPLVREADGWKLNACPWGRRLVRIAARKVETNPRLMKLRPRGRASVFGAGCSPVAILGAFLACMIPVAWWFARENLGMKDPAISNWYSSPVGLVVAVLLILAFPVSLIYYMYIRPLPNSRQLREGSPEARRQRE